MHPIVNGNALMEKVILVLSILFLVGIMHGCSRTSTVYLTYCKQYSFYGKVVLKQIRAF